jgi:hypothetical protein
MPEPRCCRILLFATLALAPAAVPASGQMDWRRLSPAQSPGPRSMHAMAYDSARKRVVLFGGGTCSDPHCRIPVLHNDTWEWDGTNWTNVTPATGSPSFRAGHAMTYDPARQRVLLFGGWAVTAIFNDTWEWDGKSWTLLAPTTRPAPRFLHGLEYDSTRQRVVLFGGLGAGYLNDTWEWDGTNWTQRNPATSPLGRCEPAMAFDSIRSRTLLFGGHDGLAYFRDTWEWDGKNWTQRNPATIPPAVSTCTMAYDAARQRAVLFEGAMWEWDGNNWSACPATSTTPWWMNDMVYDATRGCMIVFASVLAMGSDTFVYGPRELTPSTHVVSVATGGKVTLNLDAGPAHAGKLHWVAGCVSGTGTRGMRLSPTITLLLYPDWYFALTVNHPNTLIANSLGILDASGKATARIQVPPLPTALIGWRFYHAYIVFRSSLDYASTPVPLTLVP